MSRIELSICVIGKNQSNMIQKIHQAIAPLLDMDFRVETIYVDSCSNDNSLLIACRFFDHVFQISCESYASASAGRYVGTIHASGKWILYLDGDMVLSKDFLTVICHAIRENLCGDIFVGKTVDVDAKSGRVLREISRLEKSLAPWRNGKPFFGGAMLARKKCILSAGNWAPWLFANEERELLSRLGRCSIVYIDVPMVFHFTEPVRTSTKLFEIFFPMNNKFFGLGQILIRGFPLRFIRFIYIYPDMFLPWTISILVLLVSHNISMALSVFVIVVALLLGAGLPSRAVLSLSLPFKILFTIVFSKRALFIPSAPNFRVIKRNETI